MASIYAGAMRVLIWLGEDSAGEADECFRLIQNTNAVLIDMLSRHKTIDDIPPILHDNNPICSDARKWDMVRHMMNASWFSRVWVLQEVGLARSATLLYGNSHMDWSQLVELMLFVASRVDLAAHIGAIDADKIWDIFADIWCTFGNAHSWRDELPLTKSLNSPHGDRSITDILNVTRPYQATDPRDYVYAFASHPRASQAADKKSNFVIVDYNSSIDEVYRRVALHTLQHDPYPWTILSCVDHRPDSPSLNGQRPSWVPRWDEGWYVYTLGYAGMWYRAGGNQNSSKFQASVSEPGILLRVHGLNFDTITWKSQTFEHEQFRIANQKTTGALQHVWHELEHQHRSSPYGNTDEDREYAYSLTISAGRALDGGPAEDDPDIQKAVYRSYKHVVSGTEKGRYEEGSTEIRTYVAHQGGTLHNRRIFMTAKGYYGVGHNMLERGDECVIFEGANVPFILRPVSDSQQSRHPSRPYRLVGESYIQGVMRGELFETMAKASMDGDSGLKQQEIEIV